MSEKASSFTVQKNTKQDELSEREHTEREQVQADIENAPLREDLDDSSHPALSPEEHVEHDVPEVDQTGDRTRIGDTTTPDLNMTPKPESPGEGERGERGES